MMDKKKTVHATVANRQILCTKKHTFWYATQHRHGNERAALSSTR